MILCSAGWVRGLERVRGLFSGARVGVGLMLDHNEHGDIIVQEIEAGSSGHLAGVCVGDVVAKVDGRPQQVTIIMYICIYICIYTYIHIYILYVRKPPKNGEIALQTPQIDVFWT